MTLTVDIQGSRYRFHRPADLETLWQRMDDEDLGSDERIPYWVEIWPASILLARWIARNRSLLADSRCLDLGCGLGLSASIAAESGAAVLGIDYELPALTYARQSAWINNIPSVSWLQMDWRHPCLKPESVSFIWGAEILYERRFFRPLLNLFAEALTPDGRIWLASPRRPVSDPFWQLLKDRGWPVRPLTEERIDFREYAMQVGLWEVRKPGKKRPGR
jgi:predicted nicotinamide N-methyase